MIECNSRDLDWRDEARRRIKINRWNPIICVQGGGARGAWEAGVVAALLKANSSIGHPVAIWGTSAGAINALWASTAGESPDDLIDHWLRFAKRIRVAATILVIAFVLLSTAVWIVVRNLGHPRLYILMLLLLGVVSVSVPIARLIGLERLPGLVPVRYLARLIPYRVSPARFHSFFCAANVLLDQSPVMWDWNTLGIFWLRAGSTSAEYVNGAKDVFVESRVAVMCSAALPILSRPHRVGDHALLDGGLEANLPGGHIFSQGGSGGYSAVCIAPQRISELDSKNHVDFRTLKFLSDLKVRQEQARLKWVSNAGKGAIPAMTHLPTIVVEPQFPTRANLLKGFFCPAMLRKDFGDGKRQGERLIDAMQRFELGDNQALAAYLLDCKIFDDPGDQLPQAGIWKWWVNLKWN